MKKPEEKGIRKEKKQEKTRKVRINLERKRGEKEKI